MTSPVADPRPPGSRWRARLGIVLATTGLLVLTTPGSADAHVHVSSDTAAAGSYPALTFRVPNESTTARTVKLTVQLPQESPFRYVASRPVPGWTVATTEQQLPKPVTSEGTTLTKAVRTVTWTAGRGAAIAAGEYQEFSLSVGPLATAGSSVLLPTTQTYSDGTVVRWDEPTPASGEEPQHPAPVLAVTAAAGDASEATVTSPPDTGPGPSTAARPDRLARGLGVAALVVALAGLGLALTTHRDRAAAR